MRRSLGDSAKALQGLVAMSPELEAVAAALFDNRVPAAWEAKAYPSLKPLASWTTDLLERVAFVQRWIKNGTPAVYWISGFFFPQAFLTGTLQNYARKARLPIDTVSFAYHVRDDVPPEATAPPADGCYVTGLNLEGACWSASDKALAESRPKELFTRLPVVWLKPEQHRAPAAAEGGVYECPVYKTLARAGTLSTTGHLTNFVMDIELPGGGAPAAHWINRGVAAFCALAF
jgi:dynein heavy chain, axonemal